MTQAKRRGTRQAKQTKAGMLSVILFIVILFLVRNYGFSTVELASEATAQLAPQVTELLSENTATAEKIATTKSGIGEKTVIEVAATDASTPDNAETEKSVVENSESQKSNLPTLTAAGSEPEKKKATHTPKPLALKPLVTSTPTVQRATVTATTPPNRSRSQSNLPLIYYEDLPREAQQTIRLIEKGGPFPYSRDGIEFQNREGILPRESRGYYREYTVITPGSNDRGARRIVEGQKGELYYTDDHYDSFKEVAR